MALPDVAVERGLGDSHDLADLADRHLLLLVEINGQGTLVRIEGLAPPAKPAARPRRGQTGLRAFLDQVALEFRQGTEKMEGELAGRRTGVDGLMQTLKGDTLLLEIAGPRDQIPQRPSQAIETSHDQGIAVAQNLPDLLKARTLRHGATDLVDDHPFASSTFQCVALQTQILIEGRDPRIADFHEGPVLSVKKPITNATWFPLFSLLIRLPCFGPQNKKKWDRGKKERKRPFSLPSGTTTMGRHGSPRYRQINLLRSSYRQHLRHGAMSIGNFLSQAGLIAGFIGSVLLAFSGKVGVIGKDGTIYFYGLDYMENSEKNEKKVLRSHWRNKFFTPTGWTLLSLAFLLQFLSTICE